MATRTKRPRRRRSKSLRQRMLDLYAAEASQRVLNETTRLHLEQLAEEFAKESMADPVFRQQVRDTVREMVREAFGEMTR